MKSAEDLSRSRPSQSDIRSGRSVTVAVHLDGRAVRACSDYNSSIFRVLKHQQIVAQIASRMDQLLSVTLPAAKVFLFKNQRAH